MKPSSDVEARGMKAYEQARAFERLRTWRLPLIFVLFALSPLLCGGWIWVAGHHIMAEFDFGIAMVLAWLGRFQWKQLKQRYARNLRLLAEMKKEYGDDLSWVQVENHFAALEKLQRELAAESAERD